MDKPLHALPGLRGLTTSDRLRLGGLLAAALAAMLLAQGLGAPLDVDHYKFWTHLVTEGGIHAAYSGTFPHTYAIYPPVTLYFFWAAGHLYQALVDPAFDMQRALSDPTLTLLVKVPGMLFHVLLIVLIYAWTLRRHAPRTALIAALLYGLNPGVLFDIAVWGQPDPVQSFFVLVAALMLLERRPGFAAIAFAVAVMTKPQTWVLAPVFAFYVWRAFGLRHSAMAAVAWLGTVVAISLPFLIFGTWPQLIRLPQQTTIVAPFVSANAHNLWWLLLGDKALAIADFSRTRFGPSWQTIALAMVALSVLFTISRLRVGRVLHAATSPSCRKPHSVHGGENDSIARQPSDRFPRPDSLCSVPTGSLSHPGSVTGLDGAMFPHPDSVPIVPPDSVSQNESVLGLGDAMFPHPDSVPNVPADSVSQDGSVLGRGAVVLPHQDSVPNVPATSLSPAGSISGRPGALLPYPDSVHSRETDTVSPAGSDSKRRAGTLRQTSAACRREPDSALRCDVWRSLPALLAFQSFAFFFLMTKAHENHAFMALPLLAICWPRQRGMLVLYTCLSLTLALNLVLHDPVLAPRVSTLIDGQLKAAQWLNAAANLVLLLGWGVMACCNERIGSTLPKYRQMVTWPRPTSTK